MLENRIKQAPPPSCVVSQLPQGGAFSIYLGDGIMPRIQRNADGDTFERTEWATGDIAYRWAQDNHVRRMRLISNPYQVGELDLVDAVDENGMTWKVNLNVLYAEDELPAVVTDHNHSDGRGIVGIGLAAIIIGVMSVVLSFSIGDM